MFACQQSADCMLLNTVMCGVNLKKVLVRKGVEGFNMKKFVKKKKNSLLIELKMFASPTCLFEQV